MLVICLLIFVLLLFVIYLPLMIYKRTKWKKEFLQRTSQMSYEELQDYGDYVFRELELRYSHKKNYEFEFIIKELSRRGHKK